MAHAGATPWRLEFCVAVLVPGHIIVLDCPKTYALVVELHQEKRIVVRIRTRRSRTPQSFALCQRLGLQRLGGLFLIVMGMLVPLRFEYV